MGYSHSSRISPLGSPSRSNTVLSIALCKASGVRSLFWLSRIWEGRLFKRDLVKVNKSSVGALGGVSGLGTTSVRRRDALDDALVLTEPLSLCLESVGDMANSVRSSLEQPEPLEFGLSYKYAAIFRFDDLELLVDLLDAGLNGPRPSRRSCSSSTSRAFLPCPNIESSLYSSPLVSESVNVGKAGGDQHTR